VEDMETGTMQLLEGVRVLDLTGVYGAFGPRLLADLGAEVLRVEDATRPAGRGRAPRSGGGTSLHALHRNLGKQVIGLDPTNPDDVTSVDGLLAGADIVFVGTGTTLGSEPDAMLARHPHLVVTSVSPFGREGPASGWRATELVAQALAGVVYRSGVPELPPVSAPGSYCEDVGAALAATMSLIALWQVRDGGHGQILDVSAILALAQCTDLGLPLWSLLKMHQPRAGAGLYPLFECTDGLARIVLPMSPADWRSLIAWLGSPPEWTGPEWEKAMLGPDERELIMARLPERFANSTRAEVAADGDAAGLRITPVLTPAEVLTNEHTRARGTFAPIAVDEGAVPMTGLATASLFGVHGARRPPSAPRRRLDAAPSWASRPRPDRTPPAPSMPLAGIRVLEVGTGIAAPEAGRVLGEWGADVIKIETDKRADFQRRVMGGDMNPAFATPGRNKRALAVDLGTPAGVDLVHRMLPHIDVIIENNATGVIDRLGLGWDVVSGINPRIVMVGSQLYGDRGPWARQKGYGPSARAIGGLTWLWAHGPDAPRGVMTIHPDHLAGRLVALAAMAGLHARERSAAGTHVDIAQFEAVATLIGDLLLAESLEPGAAQPKGNRSPDHAPWGLYRCADDETGEAWIALSVTDDATWRALLSVAPPGLDRAGWRRQPERLADREALDEAVGAWLRATDAGRMEQALQVAGVPAGQALHPRLQAGHPHYVARGYPVPVEQPGCGSLLLEGPALTASRMGIPRCEPAPMIGQHTADICRELLRLNDDQIKALVDAGALDG
jgi:crotonobetainyl-CoA:carnitine CoA-transferase CaiB-like acyl-CoA transferase